VTYYRHPQFRGIALYRSGVVVDHVEPEPVSYGDAGTYMEGCEQMLWGDPECSCPISTTECYVTMVGDDTRHLVDVDDLTELPREDFCGECGQIGCSHDGYPREEE
jgi:hypothetical protein